MIEIKVEGVEALEVYLDSIIAKLESEAFWEPWFGIMMEARGFARSISPVDTGSYQDAHEVTRGDMYAELSIDPGARNSRTGTSVNEYAGYVEERYGVYARTGAYAERLATRGATAIGANLL